VIGAIAAVFAADPAAVLRAMGDPAIRVVSLTVTEKAYGIDRATGDPDPADPGVAADLAAPAAPTGVLGLLTAGLAARRRAGFAPFTVLCCDNLPENGDLLRRGVLGFARRIDPALADWIAAAVAFPATMVDRITPAPTAETLAEAARLTGCEDRAAVETEPFTQWVIEDRFPAGRPAWEAGGAQFVDDIAPYERMKLRMLNGSHSMLAYAGCLAGHAFVRDVMADPALAALVARHMRAAAATLPGLSEADKAAYAAALLQRFRNPAIAHRTAQIAMDGTQKLPQRLLAPAAETLGSGGDLRPFAFAVAAWMRWCLGRDETGQPYPLNDPREPEIAARLAGCTGAADTVAALLGLPGLFPAALQQAEPWRSAVTARLGVMMERGMAAAITAEAQGL
jgi:fructuronate reductase